MSIATGKTKVDVAERCAWLDESYRAIAPKTSIAKLDAKPAKKK